jgi:hypothetical protein
LVGGGVYALQHSNLIKKQKKNKKAVLILGYKFKFIFIPTINIKVNKALLIVA